MRFSVLARLFLVLVVAISRRTDQRAPKRKTIEDSSLKYHRPNVVQESVLVVDIGKEELQNRSMEPLSHRNMLEKAALIDLFIPGLKFVDGSSRLSGTSSWPIGQRAIKHKHQR